MRVSDRRKAQRDRERWLDRNARFRMVPLKRYVLVPSESDSDAMALIVWIRIGRIPSPVRGVEEGARAMVSRVAAVRMFRKSSALDLNVARPRRNRARSIDI